MGLGADERGALRLLGEFLLGLSEEPDPDLPAAVGFVQRVLPVLERAESTAAPLVDVVLRSRSLSTRGNGEEVNTRVRLPSGETGWGSDLAEDVTGSMGRIGPAKRDRHGDVMGKLPSGSVVVEFTTSYQGFQKDRGGGSRRVFMVQPDGTELPLRTSSDGVVLPSGDVVPVP